MKCQIKNCKTDAVAIERLMIYDDNSDFQALHLEPELVQIDIMECLHHSQIRKGISDSVPEFVQVDNTEPSSNEGTQIQFRIEGKYMKAVGLMADAWFDGDINRCVEYEFKRDLRAMLESDAVPEFFEPIVNELERELYPKKEVISE